MKKVIITGASSFIGRRLCKALTESKCFVYAVVRKGFNNHALFHDLKHIAVKQADMSDYDKLPEIIGESCDWGIALAWDGTRAEKRSDSALQKGNYQNSISCVKSFIKMHCKIIMTAGSQAEYGPIKTEEKVRETDTSCPNTEYGKYKLKFYNEAATLCSANNIRLIEPRFFSLYGSDDTSDTMIISMARNMLLNKKCELTQCIQLWDFLYVDDAVNALIKLLESDFAEGVYNVGSGQSHVLKYYIELMHKLIGSKSELVYGAVPYPPTGIVHTNPDVDKLCSTINWKPNISFEDGLMKVIQYQKSLMDTT